MNSLVPVEEKLPVVVGVDGTPAALQAVDLAAAEAASRGTELVIVHAWPGRQLGAARARTFVPSRSAGGHLLNLAVRRARHTVPSVDVSTALMDEGPAEALLRWSARACLLVVGHRDESGRLNGWGPTAAYMAHHSACPLLVNRGRAPSRGPVIVAVSGKRTATLRHAFAAAERAGSPVTAVQVWKSEPETGNPDAGRAAARRRLEAVLDTCGASWPEVPVTRVLITESEIAYTVERAAGRGRLLVAGIGRKGWAVEALYSATGVTSPGHRLCPVLLVPSPEPAVTPSLSAATPAERR